MLVPPEEFKIPFFQKNGFIRKLCPSCRNYYWTLDRDSEDCGDAPCVSYSFIGNSPVNKKYTIPEMREKFLSFFERHGHKRIAPYPIVARWRNDLMFTIASIIDFQPYVTDGILPAPANPLVISQPCLRFEDIDLVGVTAGRHCTIFEMGGHHAFNYSGQKEIYWKNETIEMHHELLTKDLGVNDNLVKYKEGLWNGGGNAGFDVEGTVNGLEISTLVFMQYKVIDDKMEPMPIRIVDTGYGIERWTWLSQGSPTGIHAIYGKLLEKTFDWAGIHPDNNLISRLSEKSYLFNLNNKINERAKRSIELGYDPLEIEKIIHPIEGIYAALDHTKALVFILSEGIVPSNVKEGYLCRMLYRRAFRLLHRSGIENKLIDLIESQIDYWSHDFPQLKKMKDEIIEMSKVEGDKYKDTLARGNDLVKRYIHKNKGSVPVEQLVEFYDSQGLTPEDVSDSAFKEGYELHIPADFYSLVSQRHTKVLNKQEDSGNYKILNNLMKIEKTRKLFYENPYQKEFDAKVIEVIEDNVILNQTAFYAEGGGQISDLGKIIVNKSDYDVINVESIDGIFLHKIKQRGLKKGDVVKGILDWERRLSLMRAHTATHIILGAARRVLGEHAWQAGASKGVEKSRIDISHYARLTRQQVERIEKLANMIVREGRQVNCKFMKRDQAEAQYGLKLYQGGVVPGIDVRVVDIEEWDVEACGGTHLKNTSEAGYIKIVTTERVQDGIERIIYSVGPYAIEETQRREALLQDTADLLGSPTDKIKESITNNLNTIKDLRDQLDSIKQTASKEKALQLLDTSIDVKGVRLIVYSDRVTTDYLIEIGNSLSLTGECFVSTLFSELDNRVVVKASDEAIIKGVNAGNLVQNLAKIIGGAGGGQRHFAQGGGGTPEKFKESKMLIIKILESQIK